MRIADLSIHNYRNIKRLELSFPNRVTYIVGPNGQGKTNVLEAIYLLSQAKSFRTASVNDLVPWDQGSEAHSEVRADIETSDGAKQVAFSLEDGRRKASINGNTITKARAFYGQFRAIVFSPDDIQLVKGGPAGRRRFLDRILSLTDPRFVESSVSFERALRSRNALLKKYRIGTPTEELDVWNKLVVRHGRAIAQARMQLCTDLLETVNNYYQDIISQSGTLSENEEVRLTYRSDFLDDNSAVADESILHELFERALEDDTRRGVTTRGVQRDDAHISIRFAGDWRDARTAASQGQARSIALALLLASVDYLKKVSGDYPVVLLDDIESELDTYRKSALKKLVENSKAQLFLTLTSIPDELGSQTASSSVYELEKGTLKAVLK